MEAIKKAGCFALQLDESTDITNKAQLIVYFRYEGVDCFEEDLLFCAEMHSTTLGLDIFNQVDIFFTEHQLLWTMCCAESSDGATTMRGTSNGFIAHVAQRNPEVLILHCMIHREALAVKDLSQKLQSVLDDVIKIVNYVKSKALNTRVLSRMCEDMDYNFKKLIFHCEVHWLSSFSSFSLF